MEIKRKQRFKEGRNLEMRKRQRFGKNKDMEKIKMRREQEWGEIKNRKK